MSYQQFDSLTDLQSSQTHTLLICAELVFDSLTDLQSSQTRNVNTPYKPGLIPLLIYKALKLMVVLFGWNLV